MITINLNGVTVYCGKMFEGIDAAVLDAMKALAPSRVLLIDQPPQAGLVKAIGQLREALPAVEIEDRDHHDVSGDPGTDRDRQIRGAADEVRALLGGKARISDRKSDPACSSLVVCGEAADGGTVIVTDDDLDGFLAAMKAAGITYENHDRDAAILDGPQNARTRANGLSELGDLLAKGMGTMPPFDAQRPAPRQAALAELFTKFAAAAQGDLAARDWLESKVKVWEAQVEAATKLAATAQEVATGVLLVDAVGKPRYDLGTLSALLEARKDCRVTVVRKGDGPVAAKHGGVQYSLAVVKAHQGQINLQSMLPPGFVSSPEAGVISNTTFLLHCSETTWSEEVLPRLRGEK